MTDRRTRVLVGLTLAVAGLFVLDKAGSAFWWTPWVELSQKISRTEIEIGRAKGTLAREQAIRANWSKILELLDKPRAPDVPTHFVTHLGEICDKVGVTFDMQNTPQPRQQGDFKEYVYETRFKLSWGQFIDLLGNLHDSREFLKPLRVSVASQYEKEDRLDLDLKVSTIEYAPAPSKAGVK
jgi:hypothetical protein